MIFWYGRDFIIFLKGTSSAKTERWNVLHCWELGVFFTWSLY